MGSLIAAYINLAIPHLALTGKTNRIDFYLANLILIFVLGICTGHLGWAFVLGWAAGVRRGYGESGLLRYATLHPGKTSPTKFSFPHQKYPERNEAFALACLFIVYGAFSAYKSRGCKRLDVLNYRFTCTKLWLDRIEICGRLYFLAKHTG